ncbi:MULTISPECIES: extensin family protein [Rhodomicrobium]|uniref:extensin-like domain-containing protein n=1 Tax=Rhodomicrobium TaxID=1068 RepID=UPI000B4B0F8F|nr:MULTISPECIES: extensin family protein [Rhodomicrobium]
MSARLSLVLAALILPLFASPPQSIAQDRSLPGKRPHNLSGAEKAGAAKKAVDDDDDDDDDDDEEEGAVTAPAERDKPSGDDPLEATSREGEVEGIPPLPSRALAPSLRAPKKADAPLGPEAPPERWSDGEIAEAKVQCAKLLPEGGFELKVLAPIREGICGNPAPVALKYINHTPRTELRPVATTSCGLAAALDRWLEEVVQPRAKALLQANVIRLMHLSAYVCRSRYNDTTQRISYHAFADAIDVSEFVTAKGEHINVLEHWSAGDERAQFLREAHDGACKVFGTVLGPEANAAHKNHFHLDMAKRRHSAFCQ